MGRRRLLTAAVAAAGIATSLLAVPARFVVEGVSMSPGLMPGDVATTTVFPALDRFRRPRRFDRWVIRAVDGQALKRVVGLPGEDVGIDRGDLTIDGRTVLKSPTVLATVGVLLPDAPATTGDGAAWLWSFPPREVLDDDGGAEPRSRTLEAVRDVGVVAVVAVSRLGADGSVRVQARLGTTVMPWRLTAVSRHAIVAGRLDGCIVAASWRLPGGRSWDDDAARGCLPPGGPACWEVADPWPTADTGDASPALVVGCDAAGGWCTVERIAVWRDGLLRTAANGRDRWRIGPDEVFVLGDFSGGSTDSRHWGPLRTTTLEHRIDRVRSPSGTASAAVPASHSSDSGTRGSRPSQTR
jgi:type IV secretory pathway protease TraF